MTNDEQVERVAKALSAHWNSMHTNESIGKQWMLARVAVAAMRPEPQADVLHITGPCNTGDVAPMLCGITKVVETPRSPEQPVCQACAAIQTSERNDLDQRAKAQADVLAEVRAEAKSLIRKGELTPFGRRAIFAILDKHEAKS